MPVPLLFMGAQIAGNAIASHGVSAANKAQQAGTDQALGATKRGYQTGLTALQNAHTEQQGYLSPYLSLGQGGAAQAQRYATMGQPQQGSAPADSVMVKAPDGSVRHIPRAQVQQALAARGVLV